jgi:hypothetical protein
MNGARLPDCKPCLATRHREVADTKRTLHRPVTDQVIRAKAFLRWWGNGLSYEEALAKVNDVYK